MPPSTDKPIILHFVPAPSDIPVEARVRMLLKTALRRDGLRCVRAELPDEEQPESGEAGQEGGVP